MIATILFVSLIILLVLTVPIGIAIGMSSLIAIIFAPALQIDTLTKVFVTSLDSFPLMAVPFFILAGEVMGKGGISSRLFNVANSLVGSKTGGFGIATIITCMFFAAISGSGPATVAAIGGVMIPEMVRRGYDRKFATAIVCSAGALGVVIPPSVPMVIYGVSSGTSVGDLFIGGVIPGIVIALALATWTFIYSKKQGYIGNGEKFSIINVLKSIWDAKWALLIPIIILGGIYGGIFTPTEAAALSVVAGFVVSLFIYKELPLKEVKSVIVNSANTSATIMIIVAAASALGRVLTMEHIPSAIAESLLSFSDNPLVILLIINLLLLFVGTFMDAVGAIIILTPILMPVISNYGIDPLHFGIIMVVNLSIGFITPPLGVNLFVGSGITGLSIGTLSRAVLPFLIAMLLSLAVITLIPQLTYLLIK